MTSLMEFAQRTQADLRAKWASDLSAAREEQLVILHNASMVLARDLKAAIQSGEIETGSGPPRPVTQMGVDIKDIDGSRRVEQGDAAIAAIERELTHRLDEPELEVVMFYGMTHLFVRLRGWQGVQLAAECPEQAPHRRHAASNSARTIDVVQFDPPEIEAPPDEDGLSVWCWLRAEGGRAEDGSLCKPPRGLRHVDCLCCQCPDCAELDESEDP